ncbi:TPA: hypothetical protein ACXNP4_005668 [Pseudomonas aeruginosa]
MDWGDQDLGGQMVKHLFTPHNLSEDFDKEKAAAIRRSFDADDAEMLLSAPTTNTVSSIEGNKYSGIVKHHFERNDSPVHYEYRPDAEQGSKFIITKDNRD